MCSVDGLPALWNRPGLPALAQRVRTQPQALNNLIAALDADARDPDSPLSGLTVRTLDDPSIAIVEVSEDRALYPAAHIVGARSIDPADLHGDDGRAPVLERLASLLGERGITPDHTIVLYGYRDNWFAAMSTQSPTETFASILEKIFGPGAHGMVRTLMPVSFSNGS